MQAIRSERVLVGEDLVPAVVLVENGCITGIADTAPPGAETVDAEDRLVLPGIVDIHGDAFERQLMPRGGVWFPVEMALVDTDRQLLGSGITTAWHAITLSWEPGLRSLEAAERFIAGIDRMQPALGADHRLHLRVEPTAVDLIDTVIGWFGRADRPLVAINDHFDKLYSLREKPDQLAKQLDRTGLTMAEIVALMHRVAATADQRGDVVDRVCAAARAHGLVLLSHDDDSPEVRAGYRARGAAVAEFPMNRPTATDAVAHGEHVVLGAPNVVRGGSHLGSMGAADAVVDGLCTVLASDYYYPAPLHAAFRLNRERGIRFADAWARVSANPAVAGGLDDRGRLAAGKRADIIVVDDSGPVPMVDAVYVAGRRAA